jgi:hypothetical protein
MKLTKKQINALKKKHKKAQIAQYEFSMATQSLGALIEEFTKIQGQCDWLTGDGFGFTPSSDDDTHIPIDDLIKYAEDGVEITEEFILENLSI